MLLGMTWTTSPYLQSRLVTLWQEVQSYHPKEQTEASAAVRLEFWRRSIAIIQDAPWLGHGSGSVKSQFEKTASGQKELTALVTHNPHNQIFAIVIQLGVLGGALLILMWASHLWLFRAADSLSLIGSIVVVQNIIGCMFNSHLFDFTQGSLYVIGVGVIGGMVMRVSGDTHTMTSAEAKSSPSERPRWTVFTRPRDRAEPQLTAACVLFRLG